MLIELKRFTGSLVCTPSSNRNENKFSTTVGKILPRELNKNVMNLWASAKFGYYTTSLPLAFYFSVKRTNEAIFKNRRTQY
jgi:hypothetical protein